MIIFADQYPLNPCFAELDMLSNYKNSGHIIFFSLLLLEVLRICISVIVFKFCVYLIYMLFFVLMSIRMIKLCLQKFTQRI